MSESGGKKGSFKPSAEPLPIISPPSTADDPPPNNRGHSPSAKEPPPPVDPMVDEPERDSDTRPGDDACMSTTASRHLLFRITKRGSAANLKAVGARKYAQHPSTDVWCCAYAVDDGPVTIWKPGDPVPFEFVEAARNPGWHVVAFNDAFERAVEDCTSWARATAGRLFRS